MKPKIGLVRGKFLNLYELQSFTPLARKYDFTAFASLTFRQQRFPFPVAKFPSPMDLPDFPYKMPILNRLFVDAHYLYGLEEKLRGFDIAHSAETYFHFTKQCLNAKKKGYVKKVIVTVWENIPFNNEGIWGRKAMKQRVLREADHFIAVSKRAKVALLLEGVKEERISIISPGVDTKLFLPSPQTHPKNDRIRLLFVGRLVKSKGIFELLYSLKRLTLEREVAKVPFFLTIIGAGPEKSAIQILAKNLGLGNLISYSQVGYADMPKLYQKADILVAPSKEGAAWQEQWGMALMEAQASGLAIITTQSGSILENVGKAALLIQPGDTLALEKALKQFMLQPKLRMQFAQQARTRAVTKHDIGLASKKMDLLYSSLL